jgi:WD40 repeat protein
MYNQVAQTESFTLSSYCLNPKCFKPQNPGKKYICQSCSNKIVLNERYRPIQLIGQGEFQRTFFALDEHKPSKPPCVIKQFCPQEPNRSSKAAELFHREAVLIERLGKHPQIPELYAYLEQNKFQYIVQEFINGKNLASEIEKNGAFSETQIRQLLRDLLAVLKFIHRGEVIHRDIKPDNIIRRRADSKLVLVDFGAAKNMTEASVLKKGTTIGSAEYVSPEQLRGKPVFASDIYSLGVTCLYLLTRVSPFDLFDIRENVWDWRSQLPENTVSEELGRVLDKMVQPFLKERYQSAEEVLKDLKPSNVSGLVPVRAIPIYTRPIAPLPSVKKENVSAFRCINTLKGHIDAVFSIDFSPDDRFLASCSGFWDRTVRLWDMAAGKQVGTFSKHSDGVRCVTFSPDGQMLASGTGSIGRTIKLLDVKSRQDMYVLKRLAGMVYSLAFKPDGTLLASGSEDHKIRLWDVTAGQEISTIHGHSGCVRAVCFSPDGKTLASGSSDKTIRLWDVETKKEKYLYTGHLAGISSLSFSSDGQFLASGGDDSTIKIWNLANNQLLCTLRGHSAAVSAVAFRRDDKLLASSSFDKTIKLWDFRKEQNLFTAEGHSSLVCCVKFSSDGQTLASCSKDKTIKIWRCD